MLANMLQLGTVFDWISPALSITGDIVNGGGYTFLIPQDYGWTGGEIANLLREHGIRTWGHMTVAGTLMISVPQAQAEFARYLLQRAGLSTGAVPVRHARGRSGRTGYRYRRRGAESPENLLSEIGDIRV